MEWPSLAAGWMPDTTPKLDPSIVGDCPGRVALLAPIVPSKLFCPPSFLLLICWKYASNDSSAFLMMKLFYIEIEVGEARPLSFFSFSSSSPFTAAFFLEGDLAALAVDFIVLVGDFPSLVGEP